MQAAWRLVTWVLAGCLLCQLTDGRKFRMGLLATTDYPALSIEAIVPGVTLAIEDFQATGTFQNDTFELVTIICQCPFNKSLDCLFIFRYLHEWI